MRREVLFLLTALCVSCSSAQLHYTPSGSCESDHTCKYLYSAEQSQFTRNATDPITVTANVQISCESSGTYDSVVATRYCLTVEDVDGNFLTLAQNDSIDVSTMKQYLIQEYLSGWFCFVQTSEGEVVSVYHSREEQIEAVNFKKSIAAAFQANFMGTEEKMELDPQSKHTSHYSYQQGEDGSTKMHRTVTSEDVVEYPMHVSPRDIQLVKEEDVEYREGRLSKSNGTTHVSLNGDNIPTSDTSGDGPDIDIFTYDGSFSMELQVCRLVPQATRKRRALTRQYLASDLSSEENLMAVYNETEREIELLKDIRNELGSAESIIERLQNFNESVTTTINLLEKSMILEYKYGPPEGHLPVIDYVLNYLWELAEVDSEEALSKRATIYSLLSSEGSQRSQKVLIRSFKSTANDSEKNAITVAIAMVPNPTDLFIGELETLINLRADPTDPLLLAYGAVAANAGPDMQRQMVSFLTERLPEAEAEEAALVHLLHSLGNTRSELVIEHIVRFVDHDEEVIKTTAITALRFFTGSSRIQDKLVHVVTNNATEAVVSAVIDALSEGFEQDRDMQIQEDVFVALMNSTLTLHNQDLERELENYFKMVGTEHTIRLAHTLESQRLNVTSRYQRSTVTVSSTYWPNYNTDFNTIASQSSRANDVSMYPLHRGYLWSQKVGKTSGWLKAYIQAVAGIFGGVNRDLNFKVFGKALIRGHILGRNYDAVKIVVEAKKIANRNFYAMVYVKVGHTYLVNNYDWDNSICNIVPTSKHLSRVRTLLVSFTYPIFIYVGTIDLSLRFYISFTGRIALSLEQQNIGAHAALSYTPRVTAGVEGSASLTLLLIARVGASVSLNIPYEITAEQTAAAEVCLQPTLRTRYQSCTNVYQEWPGNYVRLYAWYQLRRLGWCGSWIPYPCITWGSRRTWDAFSYTWYITSSGGRNLLSSTCYLPHSPECVY